MLGEASQIGALDCTAEVATWPRFPHLVAKFIFERPGLLEFRRGDSNGDGKVNVADGVFTLGFLFAGQEAPPCEDAADTDDSGSVDVADSIGIFNWLFFRGAVPANPGPRECGVDPTADALGCEVAPDC